LHDACDRLSATKMFIDDTPGLTALQIRTKARRLMAEHGLDLIVIDYLQLIGTTSNYMNPVQQYTEISKAMKIIARELNVPVLVLSQLSRSVEQRTPSCIPKLSDLRETGSLEQDADVVMLLYREDKYKPNDSNKNIASVLIEKHRNGATGEIKLKFIDTCAKFEEIAKEKDYNILNEYNTPDENLDYTTFVPPDKVEASIDVSNEPEESDLEFSDSE
jgi:replicative DNA helicase